MKKFLKWFFIVLGILFVIGIIGAITNPPQNSTQETSTQIETSKTDTSNNSATEKSNDAVKETVSQKPDLELIETHTENDGFVRYICGTIKNNSEKKYIYVQVTINLYDDNGNQVGSTMANVNNLEPQGTWKFKAIVTEDNATKYKVTDITGW